MKKVLALILAVMFAVSALTACNNTETPSFDGNEVSDNQNSGTNADVSGDALTYSDVQKKIDAIAPRNEYDNTTVMTIGNHNVTLAEYRYYYMNLAYTFAYYYGFDWQNNAAYVEEFNNYVNTDCKMIGIVADACEENGVYLTDKEFDENIVTVLDQIKTEYGDTADQILFDEYFATTNIYLEYQSAYLLSNKLFQYMSTNEASENYNEFKQQTLDFYNENDYVRAKHILIQFPTNTDGSEVTEEQKAEAKAKAEEVLAKVNNGEDFDALIEQYNEDPGMTTNPTGYYFGKGSMVEPFETATYALEEGAVSGLVETTYGYHIIKRLPIDDSDISTSQKFLELASSSFNETLTNLADSAELVKVENFDELVKPVHDEAAMGIADMKAQSEAANQETANNN